MSTDALRNPKINGTYFHHLKSGNDYKVISTGIIKATLEPAVIYQGADGIIWIRPVSEFTDGRFICIDCSLDVI